MTSPAPADQSSQPSPPSRPRDSIAQRVSDHPATPWVACVLGVVILGADGWFLFRHPPAGNADRIFHGAWGFVGLVLIPGIASSIASGIRTVGAAAGPFIPWKSNGGGAS